MQGNCCKQKGSDSVSKKISGKMVTQKFDKMKKVNKKLYMKLQGNYYKRKASDSVDKNIFGKMVT